MVDSQQGNSCDDAPNGELGVDAQQLGQIQALEQEISRVMLAVMGTSTLSSRRKHMGKTTQQGRARLARNPLELCCPRTFQSRPP